MEEYLCVRHQRAALDTQIAVPKETSDKSQTGFESRSVYRLSYQMVSTVFFSRHSGLGQHLDSAKTAPYHILSNLSLVDHSILFAFFTYCEGLKKK